MNLIRLAIAAMVLAALAACGGGGSSTGVATSSGPQTTSTATVPTTTVTTPTNTPTTPPMTGYAFVMPIAGQYSEYASSISSVTGSVANFVFTESITSVGPNGSYTTVHNAGGDVSVSLNGTTITFTKSNPTFNNAGQYTSDSYYLSDGTLITCQDSPHGDGAPASLNAGQT